MDPTIPPAHEIANEQLPPVLDLYDRALYLQAYRATLDWGPPQTWRGTRAVLLGGRLAAHLGGAALSHTLLRRAWRENPADPETQYFYAYCLLQLRGPFPTWLWMQRRAELPGEANPDTQSSWFALFAQVAGMLRDFDTAESWLRRAEEVLPEGPWIKVCLAQLREWEDRYNEALEAARQALALRPWYRPGVQSVGHLLTLLDRDEQALELLSEASQRLESVAVVAQLFALQLELKLYDAARQSLERCTELSPLADARTRKWLAGQRSEIAYRFGDIAEAVRQAEASDSEFLKEVAKRLQDPARAQAKVVVLPVGFVRQHHLTCAPATLSAISRFWSMPADHLQVADEICYNGTSNYSERKWADDHGWVTREFTVTEASAAALLDRGIPFTFATVEPGNAHLQAVIGYDGRRGTLVTRDPYWRNSGEGLTDKILERYQAHGPRGMALVPAEQRATLEELELPDADLWDQLHALDGALEAHHREEAERILAQAKTAAPHHRLAAEGRRRLAIYDSNPAEHLAALDAILKDYPDDQALQLERLSIVRDLSRRDERLAIYRTMCDKKETHPIFWQQYAQELRADARRHDDAIWLLRRAIRRWPSEAANYFILGNIYWDQRRFDEALELYRFAACLSEREEQFASSYFSAATFCQQTEAVLAFLRNRFQRFGRRSSLPARTLFSAYMQLDRIHEALAVVEEALRLRPDDGELRLFAADAYVACSTEHTPRALELLEQAKPNAPEVAWRRTAARLASTDGRLNDALVHWQRILELQPLAVDAHRAVTQLLAETQGSAAALAHLQQATDRFPHHHPVHELWIQWLRDEPSEVREPVIRRVVEMNPDDAWVRRELALVLADQKRFDEAWEQVHCAGQLEPTNPSYHTVRSYLLRCQGQIAEARQALRAAIELSVDDDFAIGELIGLCDTLEERREALTFVKDQLVRQVIFGDGLLAFQMHARDTLEPGELLHELREALAARPDLWHGWSAVVGQLLDMDQVDEAWQLVVQATERFPLLPRLWLDRAVVCRARGQPAAEREALETAYRINPSWGTAVRALSDLYERCGEYDRARELLEHAVGRNPLDVVNHVLLAEALWRLGQREAALERVHHAVQIEPGYDRAWSCLNEWSEALGCPERAMQTAREITQRRGGEARSWLILARLLDAPDQLDERLAALAKAIELNPRCDDAYDVQAVSLALAGRWDEALASCRPAAWGDRPPPSLQVRAAWIEAQRGDLDTAIARLREIVQAEPQYVEAWSLLADWYAQRGDQEQYLEIAETLVRLRPQSEIAWGYLGEARLVQGDRDAAREAFRRALELNPTYEFAGNNLFDLQLEDGELDGAAQTLALVQTHSNGPFVVARETRLAAKRGYRDEACDALKRVCLLPSESNWPVAVAVDAVAESWSPGVAEQILEERIFADGAHPEVGVQWIKLRTGRKDWGAGARLCELLERGEIGRQATYAYIDALRRAGARRLLLRFVGQNRTWLRQQTFTWGAVGFGLAGIRAYREAAEWHADWASREGAEPWMLVNAIEGLRALGRDEEAAEASRAALALPPGYGQHLHHLWLAADEILGDNLPAARQHLDQAKTDKLDDDWQFQLALVEALVEMAEAPPAEAGPVFRSVRRKVARARAGYKAWTHEPARRRLYRRVLAKIARQRGTFAARLWHWLRWIQSF